MTNEEESKRKIRLLTEEIKKLFPDTGVLITILTNDGVLLAAINSCPACLVEFTIYSAIRTDMKHDDGAELLSSLENILDGEDIDVSNVTKH